MKIILTDEVRHLGHRGDVVTVAPGYARNFLLPKALALPATDGNVKRLEQEKHRYDARVAKDKEHAEQIAKSMEGITIVLKKRAGEHQAIYGSVTTHDLADALIAKGVTVDRRKIEIEEPIKKLGQHTVHVKLHREVSVGINVDVQAL